MIRDFLLGCFINGLIAIALALFNGAQTQTDAPVTPVEFRFA
jgi:hypothetical protein